MMVYTNTWQLAEFIFKSPKMQKEKLLQIPDFKNFSPKTTRNYAPSESPNCKIKEKILQTPDLKNFSPKTTPNSDPSHGGNARKVLCPVDNFTFICPCQTLS